MHLRKMKLLYLGLVLIVTLLPNNAAPKPQEDGDISVGAVMSSASLVNDPNYIINMKKPNSNVRVVVIRRKKNNEDETQAVLDKNVMVRNTFDSLLSKSIDGQPLFEPRKSKRIWPVRKNSTERANDDSETAQPSVSTRPQHKRKWQLGKNGPKVEEISETDNYPEEFKRRRLNQKSQNSSQSQQSVDNIESSFNSESKAQTLLNTDGSFDQNTKERSSFSSSQQRRIIPNQSSSQSGFASRPIQQFSTTVSTTAEDDFTIRPGLPQPINSGINFNNQRTTNNYNPFSFTTSTQRPRISSSTVNFEDNLTTKSGVSQFSNSQSIFRNDRPSTQQTFSPFSFSTTQKPFVSSFTTNKVTESTPFTKGTFENLFTTSKPLPSYGNSQIEKSDRILNQFKLARITDDAEPLTIEFTDDVLASLTPQNGQPFGKAGNKQTKVSNDYFKTLSGQLNDDKTADANRRRLISEIQKSVDDEDKPFILEPSIVELDDEDEALKKLANRPKVQSFESVFGFTRSPSNSDFSEKSNINTERSPTVNYDNGRIKIDVSEFGSNKNINLKIGTNLGSSNTARTTQTVPVTSFSSIPTSDTFNSRSSSRFNLGNNFNVANDFNKGNSNNNNNFYSSTPSPNSGNSYSLSSQSDYTTTTLASQKLQNSFNNNNAGLNNNYFSSTPSSRVSSYSFGSQADYTTTTVPSEQKFQNSFQTTYNNKNAFNNNYYTTTTSPRGSSYSFGSQTDYTTSSPNQKIQNNFETTNFNNNNNGFKNKDYTSTPTSRGSSSYSFGSQADYTTTSLPQNSFSSFGFSTGNSSPKLLNTFENTQDTKKALPNSQGIQNNFNSNNNGFNNYHSSTPSSRGGSYSFGSQTDYTTTNLPQNSFSNFGFSTSNSSPKPISNTFVNTQDAKTTLPNSQGIQNKFNNNNNGFNNNYYSSTPSSRGGSYSFGSQADYTTTTLPQNSFSNFGLNTQDAKTTLPTSQGIQNNFNNNNNGFNNNYYSSTPSSRGGSYSFGSQADYTTTTLPQNSFSNFGFSTSNSSPKPLNSFGNIQDTKATTQTFNAFGSGNLQTNKYDSVNLNAEGQINTNFPSTGSNYYTTPSTTTSGWKHGSFSFGTSIEGNGQGNTQTSGRGFGSTFQGQSENDSPIIRISTIQPLQSQSRSLNTGFQSNNGFGSNSQVPNSSIAANVNNLQPIRNTYQDSSSGSQFGVSIQNKNNVDQNSNSNFGTFNSFPVSNLGVRSQVSNTSSLSENDKFRGDSSFNSNVKSYLNETDTKNIAYNTNRFGNSNYQQIASNNSKKSGLLNTEPNNNANTKNIPTIVNKVLENAGGGVNGFEKINTESGFLVNNQVKVNDSTSTKNLDGDSNNQYNKVNNKDFSQTRGDFNFKTQQIANTSYVNPSTSPPEKTLLQSTATSRSDLSTTANKNIKGLSNNKQTYYINAAGEKVYDNSRSTQRVQSNSNSRNSDLSLAQSSAYGGRDEDVKDFKDDISLDLERGAKKYKPTRFETISPYTPDSHYKQVYQNSQVSTQNGGQQILTRGSSNFDLEAKKSISRDEYDLNVDDNSINTGGKNKNTNENIYRGSVKFKFDPYSVDYDEENTDFPDQFGFRYNTSNGISAYQKGVAKKINNRKVFVVHGSYEYTAPDGTPIYVNYTADEHGFRTQESHLPIFLEEPKTTPKTDESTPTEKSDLEYENNFDDNVSN